MSTGNDGKNKKLQELDDFWDLSSLVPPKSSPRTPTRSASVSSVQIESNASAPKKENTESTVIKRYRDPLHYENKKIRKESYISEETYYPENSLIHRVILRKRKCEYELYAEFFADAKRYYGKAGKECEFAPYYSYVPQYNQLNATQLSYYLWWRTCFESGKLIRIDYSYLLLYIFELINFVGTIDPKRAQEQLCNVWNLYHNEFAALSSKLLNWICDFSLLHKLKTPENISNDVGRCALVFREFYLNIPVGDYDECARSLLRYGTEYDYRKSKFATGDNLKVFDKYVYGAIVEAVRFFSKNGVMLSELSSEDSKIIRNVFEGALCTNEQRYEIEIKYCSLSRSNELRYLMADVVKYAENKIRTYLGIKSKLSVYMVSTELQKKLDAYFEATLFNIPKPTAKKEEKHDYDVLYDLPKVEFSLERAMQIENSSWSVTNDLISAFEREEISAAQDNAVVLESIVQEVSPEQIACGEGTGENAFCARLGEYLDFARALKSKDLSACRDICARLGKLEDAVVDAINEIAVEEIGDMLIEEGDDGFEIIDCYSEMI